MIPRFWLEQKSIWIEVDWREMGYAGRGARRVFHAREHVRRPSNESMAFSG